MGKIVLFTGLGMVVITFFTAGGLLLYRYFVKLRKENREDVEADLKRSGELFDSLVDEVKQRRNL